MERIAKYYEEIGKIIKDLTFSYLDRRGELWDDRKKNGRKLWIKDFLMQSFLNTSRLLKI